MNVRILPALHKIGTLLERVRVQALHYSGVSKKDAVIADNDASKICEMGAEIATAARLAQGDASAKHLVKNVRKALGYTYP
jgi:hypothetical protein